MLDFNYFKKGDPVYGSAPFWAWNDKLDKDELIRQINQMHNQGMGGFFMHPRGGLKDEYLGDEFMEAVKACVQEAQRLGMKAWLYDEDRFPSGSAGGKVVQDNPEYGAKALEMLEMPCNQVKKDDAILKIYWVTKDSGILKYNDITEKSQHELEQLHGSAWVFRVIYMHSQSNCNNKPYTDICYKDAIDKFIQVTHEKYKESVKEYFGNAVPGIFTDEPSFNVVTSGKNYLPWTHEYENHFQKRKGYCILEHMPELFFDVGDYKKVRFDFWDVFTGLFNKSFVKNIYDWCENNDLNFTGHYWEHAFPNPTHSGSVMPHYEFMQYPGIDMLFNTKEEDEQVGNDLIVKEVSSVGNQLDKERILSETYGASGWDLDLAEMKRVADWQFALGINLICQHLVLYSMTGYRKRDFPLSHMDHQPYWNCYHLIGDYLGRMCYVMSQGKYVGDVLVLHPSSSTWAEFNILDSDNVELKQMADSFKKLIRILCRAGYFFDLGDDIIIERHAKVENGNFIIGNMSYTTIILPDMTVMRSSNFNLIKEFIHTGGRVITTGITPTLLDGIYNRELQQLFESNQIIRCKSENVKDILAEFNNQHIVMEDFEGHELHEIYSHKRILGDAQVLFLSNYSRERKYNVRLQLDKSVDLVEEWDAVNGERKALTIYENAGNRYIDLVFYPSGSHLLIMQSGEKRKLPKDVDRRLVNEKALHNWVVERKDYNALTIQNCSVSVNGGEWSPEKNVVATDDEIRRQLDLDIGNIFGPQPWTYTKEEKENVVPLKASYTFNLLEDIKGDLYLAAESPDIFKVYVNGILVAPTGQTYKDRAFTVYEIKDKVRLGKNEIVLSTDSYGILTNIESIYIVGDFKLKAIENDFGIAEEDNILSGDWTKQGYPYYSGAMDYKTSFELEYSMLNVDNRIKLHLNQLWGIAFKVFVNGKETGVLGWQPYELDITEYVHAGSNEVKVEVMNSLQNLLGPHQPQDIEGIVTPGSFYTEKATKFTTSGFDGIGSIRIFK